MKNVVIVDGVRLAIGKLGGSLIGEPADHLAATVLEALVERSEIDKSIVDEIILGQAKQTTDISNIGRVASIRAGFPLHIPGYTVHRQCGSGLQAINNAMQQIQCGYADIIIAGGAESMSTAPYYVNGTRFGTKAGNVEFKDPNTASQAGSQPYEEYGNITMGYTAENIAEKYNISRERQDAFALSSQEKAAEAIKGGKFKDEIVPYVIKTRKGEMVFDTDEYPRATSMEALAKLKPVFKEGGSVTAGNASGRNDGAAALLIMSEEKAEELGLSPMVRVIAQAAVGCDPLFMGMGPVHATQKALKQAALSIEDIDIVELNEAFAAQSIACIDELGIEEARVNPNGGAIALGHPIGATGAIITTKLIHELVRSNKRYGLITLCIAGGLGIATIVENAQYNH